jgi:hypothetical protein
MIRALVIAIVLAGAAQSPVSMPDPNLIRISLRATIGELTPDEAGTRQSVKDISSALAGKKKTLTVVDDPHDADVEVQIVSRSVVTPKVLIGLGPRSGEPMSVSTPQRSVVLRVTVTSGDQKLEFANKNKPVDMPEGWKSAAGDLANQIDKWVAAHRDEIIKRRDRRPPRAGPISY